MVLLEQSAVLNHMRSKYDDPVSTTDFGHSKRVACEKYGRKLTAVGDTWEAALEKLDALVEKAKA